VLPLLMVELYLLRARGLRVTLRDPVPWCILAVLVTHLVFALVGTPEYLSVVVPFATEAYTTPGQMLSNAGKILLGLQLGPVTLLLPLLAAAAFTSPRMGLARLLTVFAAAGALISALQGKGWDYHSVPALLATLLLMLVVLTGLIEGEVLADRSLAPRAGSMLAAFLLVPFFFLDGLRLLPFRDQLWFEDSDVHAWVELLNRTPGNQRALVVSAGMYPQYPALNYAGFQMTMPFMSLWALRGLYEECGEGQSGFRPLEAQSPEEEFVFRSVVEGFTRDDPQYLVIDRGDGLLDCGNQAFDYLAYFSRDVRFAREFRNYRPLTTLGKFAFYERAAAAIARP
jgi:hypothetical protein